MCNTTFIIHFHTTESGLAEFGEAMRQLSTELLKVSGCLAVSAYQNQDDRTRFTVVETWDSQTNHQHHVAGLVANGTWEHLSSLLLSEPSGAYFIPV